MLPENHDELEQFIAACYESGFDVVPVAKDAKAPTIKNWPKIERFEWPAFIGKNIGCRGTDVLPIDIDDPVAASLAVRIFDAALASQGGVIYDGRASRPVSHLYVRVRENNGDLVTRRVRSESPLTRTNYPAPVGVEGCTYLIELKHHRGLQAVMAPSVHPSGETLAWYQGVVGIEGHPGLLPTVPFVSADQLEELLQYVWLARALVGLWRDGHRHNLCLWVGTWLFQCGVQVVAAERVMRAVMQECEGEVWDRDLESFTHDWEVQDGASGVLDPARKGYGGVRGIVAHVHGEALVDEWFARLGRVWPALRGRTRVTPGADMAALGQALGVSRETINGGAGSGDGGNGANVIWTEGAEAELSRMLRECTSMRTLSSGAIHDLSDGSVSSVSSWRLSCGEVGRTLVGPRGGERFEHVVDLWAKAPGKRVADGTAYLPGADYGEIVDGVVNMFRRGPIWQEALIAERVGGSGPVSDADVDWYLSWVARVIPDAEERRWFHLWVAFVLNYPERRPGWALYMISPLEGMGRTSLAETLGLIMGRENARPVSVEEIKSGYTNWAADSVLRYANEAREAGSWRGTIAARLQETISDRVLGVTRKYAASVQVPNFGGFMLLSNSISEVHIKRMSRRYCCISNGRVKPSRADLDRFFGAQADPAQLVSVCRWYLQRRAEAAELPPEAPRTRTFSDVVDESSSDAEFLVGDAAGFLGEVFTLRQLARWMDGPIPRAGGHQRNAELRNMLRAAGYRKVARVRFGEHRERCYAHETAHHEYAQLDQEALKKRLLDVDKRLNLKPEA